MQEIKVTKQYGIIEKSMLNIQLKLFKRVLKHEIIESKKETFNEKLNYRYQCNLKRDFGKRFCFSKRHAPLGRMFVISGINHSTSLAT